MNTKAEKIASEIEVLATQFEEKKHLHSEQQLAKLLKENEIVNFDQISVTECHVISCIGSIEEANGINIAEKLNITRGGICKIAARLMEKNLIKAYKDKTNQKKVFYALTPLGEKVNSIHDQLHKENHRSLCEIAGSYTFQEQDVILDFIKKLQNNNRAK